MDDHIGDAAGKVWAFLDKHGQASCYKIGQGTGLSRTMVQRALGWLAREGKTDIRKDDRGEMIRLR